MEKVIACLMIAVDGRRHRVAFYSIKAAAEFAYRHYLEIVSSKEMTLEEAERRGYEF